MNTLFSIIIPACNSEHCLGQVVESIVHNKERNYEIIIVENGSVDNTLKIAYELKKKYSCIRVYQTAKGVSNARNIGIEKSIGKWICFVDADDIVSPNLISKYIKAIKSTSAKLIIFSYKKGYCHIEIQGKQKTRDQIICNVLKDPTRFATVWAKLFNREIIDKFTIRFDTDLFLSEDSIFLLEYMLKVEKIEVNRDCVYEYCMNSESVTQKFDGMKEIGYVEALERARAIVAGENNQIKSAFNVYAVMQLNLIMVKEVFEKENGLDFLNRIFYMKQLTNKKIFRNAIKNISWREFMAIRMLPILFIKLHFYFGAASIYYLRMVFNRIGVHK